MNTFNSRAIKAYASIGVETGVVSASPHQLILMLYEGAITAVSTAQKEMRLKNVEARGHAASKAISIIRDGLSVALQPNVGGELAKNLSDLYQYMEHRLFEANLNNDPDALEEVRKLLLQLKGAWEGMTPSQGEAPVVEVANPGFALQSRRAANSYGSV